MSQEYDEQGLTITEEAIQRKASGVACRELLVAVIIARLQYGIEELRALDLDPNHVNPRQLKEAIRELIASIPRDVSDKLCGVPNKDLYHVG